MMTKRRKGQRYPFRGDMKTVSEIAEVLKMSENGVRRRLANGITIEERDILQREHRTIRSQPSRTANLYTHDGRTMTLREWAREAGCTKELLAGRLRLPGWTFERAITAPVCEGRRPSKLRPFQQKNLLIIARIAKATARALLQHQTGGQSRTSPNPPRTGVVSTAHDLHHHEGARP